VSADDPALTAAQVRPFEVDAEVMANIRPMQFHDAPEVARLHQAAMGTSLWARLGPAFLTQLYQALVNNPRFLGFVYEEGPLGPDRRIRGFIAGSQDTERMFAEVRRAAWFLLLPTALSGALRHPRAIPKLLQTARYFRQSAPSADLEVRAESLFCSFEPDLRGKRVSGHINKVLFDDLCARGHRRVKITTEVDNEGANRQLRSWGFAERGRFRFYGKEMVLYVLDLQRSPRVEPVARHPTI
jgi:RimJ/RimL family protein N-acetyltransferase